MYACDDAWGINMKTFTKHLIEDNGEHRKIGYLPYARRNYHCYLGALASESFSEGMISVASILAHACRNRLDRDTIYNIVVL